MDTVGPPAEVIPENIFALILFARGWRRHRCGMRISQDANRTIQLADGQAMTIRLPLRGAWLVCLHGCLWVTEPGDRDDRVLREGERMALLRRRGIVISAIGGARAALELAPRATAVLRPMAAACADC